MPSPADVSYECGSGWAPLLDALVADLVALWSDVRIDQIKEKFGGLRVYISYPKDPVLRSVLNARIKIAAAAVAQMCEVCGLPGRIRRDGWIRVLCHDHAVDEGRELSRLERDLVAKLGPTGTNVAVMAARRASEEIVAGGSRLIELDAEQDQGSFWWTQGRHAHLESLRAAFAVLAADRGASPDVDVDPVVATALGLDAPASGTAAGG